MRARRALLYVPGDDLHKITKAAGLEVDSVCLDMEDGVAANRKPEARQTIVTALQSLDFGRTERLARINPVGSGLERLDLESVLPAHPDGIVVPKVETAEQVQWVSDRILQAEQDNNWTLNSIALLILIETARAITNLKEIAGADERLQALIFGAEDLAGDIGAVRTPQGWEVFYARSAVVTYAAAFVLQAIDMVYVDFHDREGLIQESIQGAQMGYAGKQIIHPSQVIPVQEAFTPSPEAIEHALRVMKAYESHQEEGQGAFALDGKMVDAPIVKIARQVLARAYAAGIVTDPYDSH